MTTPGQAHRRASGGGRPWTGREPVSLAKRQVQGVGRHEQRDYCGRCGQKVRACACSSRS